MTSCTDLMEDLELLALGELEPARATAVRAHLVACASCKGEHEMLVAERALFLERTRALDPAPCLETAILAAARSADEGPRPLRFVHRIVPLVAAACAAAALFVAVDRRLLTRGETAIVLGERTVIETNEAEGEALACALPVSGHASLAPHAREELACMDGRIACEERVTSSIATP